MLARRLRGRDGRGSRAVSRRSRDPHTQLMSPHPARPAASHSPHSHLQRRQLQLLLQPLRWRVSIVAGQHCAAQGSAAALSTASKVQGAAAAGRARCGAACRALAAGWPAPPCPPGALRCSPSCACPPTCDKRFVGHHALHAEAPHHAAVDENTLPLGHGHKVGELAECAHCGASVCWGWGRGGRGAGTWVGRATARWYNTCTSITARQPARRAAAKRVATHACGAGWPAQAPRVPAFPRPPLPSPPHARTHHSPSGRWTSQRAQRQSAGWPTGSPAMRRARQQGAGWCQ